MKIGYVIASNEVMVGGKSVGYLYRERPDNSKDSGWRLFSGEETQEYADDPSNFAMYNVSTVVERDSAIGECLGHDYPVAFERDSVSGRFITVSVDAEDE
jgi:hypothetical protein